MSEAAPLWSAEQHGWLEALGHAVWMQGALPEAVVEVRPAPMATDGRPLRQPPAAPPRKAPALAAETPPMKPAERVASARRGASRMPDRLHFALIRASGCNPNAPGAAELFAAWPASSELRGNPAAKRALWPRLRALRRLAQP